MQLIKKIDSFNNELKFLKYKHEKQKVLLENTFSIKKENISFKNKDNFLTNDLAWFMKGKEFLKTLLRLQKYSFDKGGIGYSQYNYKKIIKISLWKHLVHQSLL